jgi:hypothetical protein
MIGSLSPRQIVRATHFLSIGSKHFTMYLKRREYHVDRHSANLDAWFDNFRAFLIEFDFASVGDDGEPTFTEAQLRQIMNVT